MKKLFQLCGALAIIMSLAACGTANNNANKNIDTTDTEPAVHKEGENREDALLDERNSVDDKQGAVTEGQQDMIDQMKALDYKDFEFEVEYADNSEYKVDIETKQPGNLEVTWKDTKNNKNQTGTDAFKEVFPLVEQAKIGKDTTKEDAISKIVSTFDLPKDYTKFELDIEFTDGTKLEFEDRK